MYRSFYLGVIILCILKGIWSSENLQAQNLRPYIGLHGGINLTQASVQQSFQIISLLDSDEPMLTEYSPVYTNFGNQIGFSLFMDFNDKWGIGLLPQQVSYNYSHSFVLEFVNSNNVVTSRTETQSNQKLTYINIPLIAKYTIRKATWSPYVFGGFSYGILRSASGENTITSTQILENTVEVNPVPSISDQLFITSKLNLLGGIGILYDLKQVQLGLDFAYWYGLHTIVNEANRYTNQIATGYTYDLPSDIKLNHYALNLMVLFPINKVNTRGSLDCIPFKKRK